MVDEKNFFDILVRNLEKNSDRLSEIEKIQAAHLEILKDHTRRSLANEEAIIIARETAKTSNDVIIAAIAPLQKHVTQVETILKIIGVIAASAGTIVGLVIGVLEIIKRV